MSRLGNSVKLTCKAGALTVVLVLGVSVLLLFAVSYHNQSTLAWMKKHGRLLTPAELAGPKIPDEKNGAILYEQAIKTWESAPEDVNLYVLRDFLDPKRRSSDPKLWDKARKTIDNSQEIISFITKAQQRPGCRFNVDWSRHGLHASHAYDLRKLSCLTASGAIIAAQKGDTEDAVRFLQLSVRLNEATCDEPSWRSQLDRQNMVIDACIALKDAANYTNFDKEQLERLNKLFGNIELNDGFIKSLLGTLSHDLRVFQSCSKDRDRVVDMLNTSIFDTGKKRSETEIYILSLGWKPVLSPFDKAAYLKSIEKQIAAVKYSLQDAKSEGLLPEREDLSPYTAISGALVPFYSNRNQLRFEALSCAKGSQVFLVLLAYKAKFGSYPSSLKQLRMKLGWQIPKDPITGEDFIYKRTTAGFTFYSVGLNLKDDHCRQNDIVWKMER